MNFASDNTAPVSPEIMAALGQANDGFASSYGADALTMKSLVDIQAGQEVLNDYGSLPRSDLLRRYGYITPAYAQFDVVELERELLVEAVQRYKPLEKADLEKRVGCDPHVLPNHMPLDCNVTN